MLSVLLLSLAVSLSGALLAALLTALPVMKSKRAISRVLYLSAGLMLFITCFDLLPEALAKMPLLTLVFIFSGAALIAIGRAALERKLSIRSKAERASLLILVGLALHNLPEGMAIGAGAKACGGNSASRCARGACRRAPVCHRGKKAELRVCNAPAVLSAHLCGRDNRRRAILHKRKHSKRAYGLGGRRNAPADMP